MPYIDARRAYEVSQDSDIDTRVECLKRQMFISWFTGDPLVKAMIKIKFKIVYLTLSSIVTALCSKT